MKIIIDARFLGTPTGIGRYVEELIVGLEDLVEAKHRPNFKADSREDAEFVILVSKEGWEKLSFPSSANFIKTESPPQACAKGPSRCPSGQHEVRAQFKKRLVDVHWYTAREQFALWRVLREEKPDLVHFPHWNICYFWNGPFVVTIHDLILLEYPTRRASALGVIPYWIKYKILFPLVLRKAIYKSKKIIVPSDYTKQSILKHFSDVDPGKIEVIYEGASQQNPKFEARNSKQIQNSTATSHLTSELNSAVDKSTVNCQLSTVQHTANTNYLLYVGNALPHKNLEFLVRVFKDLKTSFAYSSDSHEIRKFVSCPKLVLVGESSYFYKRLKKYVKSLGLENDVIFTGRVSDNELAELYKNAAVYVFPSLLEGFGLPPLEAMACGVPVLAANSSCLPEILGTAALYFDPKDEDEAILKIKEILINPALRQDLIQKGYEQIKKYDWKNTAERTLKIYKL